MARKMTRVSKVGPPNSVDLFDLDKKNEEGKMFCVATALLKREVEFYWDMYIEIEEIFEDCSAHRKQTIFS